MGGEEIKEPLDGGPSDQAWALEIAPGKCQQNLEGSNCDDQR